MMIEQGNKKFFSMESCGRTIYYVSTIDGRNTTGRQGSYIYVKCSTCGKIVGTQFKANLRHYKTHEKEERK